ncbi:calcium/sodium antiporter [Zavarzinia compransoris]|uniref:calcium/sodium antiporter n=1 Tax=Zavarzinia marina TaxID=2911065 RepID=UPI001F4914FE|nr:calcium/sodium antiporter [Zavarzinia marina]MCF4166417.1 calcium/sodium antiporter [Zavarzinia marina]
MGLDIVFVVGGLLLLFFGGEFLVRGSVAIADRFGISKLIVGMVIIGFGTSAPELLVSVQAALAGSPDIAVGNVVGSNISNILLIVAVAALVAPIANDDKAIRRDAGAVVVFSIATVLVFMLGEIGRVVGIAMVALLFAYLGTTYVVERRRQVSAFTHEADEARDIPMKAPLAAVITLAGLALLVVGARLMVDGATGIARAFGISEAVIGLTVVAVGTSLPELATAVVAAMRKHSDVVLANVAGSNIFNLLCILGITAIITPVPVAPRFATMDGPLMIVVAMVLLGLLFAFRVIGRGVGAALLAAYGGYIALQAI